MNNTVPADHRVKLKEDEKRNKYIDLARELKNLWNMKVTVILIVDAALRTIPRRTGKGPGKLRNQRTNRDYQDYRYT